MGERSESPEQIEGCEMAQEGISGIVNMKAREIVSCSLQSPVEMLPGFEMFQSQSGDLPSGHRIRETGHRLIHQLEINDGFDLLKAI
jgi:hypothetical protein